jgi:hypothetical protein
VIGVALGKTHTESELEFRDGILLSKAGACVPCIFEHPGLSLRHESVRQPLLVHLLACSPSMPDIMFYQVILCDDLRNRGPLGIGLNPLVILRRWFSSFFDDLFANWAFSTCMGPL